MLSETYGTMSMTRQSEKLYCMGRRLASVAKQNGGPIQHIFADQLTDANYCDILV